MNTKKIVYGGRRGYDKAIERHKAKGWIIKNESQKSINQYRTIYIAELIKEPLSHEQEPQPPELQ